MNLCEMMNWIRSLFADLLIKCLKKFLLNMWKQTNKTESFTIIVITFYYFLTCHHSIPDFHYTYTFFFLISVHRPIINSSIFPSFTLHHLPRNVLSIGTLDWFHSCYKYFLECGKVLWVNTEREIRLVFFCVLVGIWKKK